MCSSLRLSLTLLVLLLAVYSANSFVFNNKLIHKNVKTLSTTNNNLINIKNIKISTALFATKNNKIPRKTLSGTALLSYVSATSLQFSLIFGFLQLFDRIIHGLGPLVDSLTESSKVLSGIITGKGIQTAIVSLFFLFMSVKSRVFSPLDNSRPKADIVDPRFRNRVRPSWMPPPKAFPIIWSTIGLLRTVSSVLIWQTTDSLLSIPLLSLILHLCIGDTWNTINNVENRLGTAFLGVNFVLGSAVYAVYQYYLTLPLAGKVLAPSAVWLSIAYVLVFSIWRLNFELFDYPSLLPSREEGPPSPWRMPFMSLKK
jgi:tryptophan-rich sensory protein